MSYVDELLHRFTCRLQPSGVSEYDAEHLASLVLAMPATSRAEHVAQIGAWLAGLDQLAAERLGYPRSPVKVK